LFAKEQPDLNWECEEAREKIFDIIRFWNEKGVDGYRVDAISYLDKGLDGRVDFQETMGTVACANLEGTHRYIREMAGGQDFSVITINRGRYLFMAMMACTGRNLPKSWPVIFIPCREHPLFIRGKNWV